MEIYQGRAKQWQEAADALPAGVDRDGCLVLTEGYAKLVEIIRRLEEKAVGKSRRLSSSTG